MHFVAEYCEKQGKEPKKGKCFHSFLNHYAENMNIAGEDELFFIPE